MFGNTEFELGRMKSGMTVWSNVQCQDPIRRSVHTTAPFRLRGALLCLGIWLGRWAKNQPRPSSFLEAGLNLMLYFESFIKAPSGVYWTSACHSLILSPSLHDWLLSAGEAVSPSSAAPGNLRWTLRNYRWWRRWGLSVSETPGGRTVCSSCKQFSVKAGWISWLEFFLRTFGTALLYGNMYVHVHI